MPNDDQGAIAARIAHLAAFLADSDAVRVRIEREDEEIEIARYGRLPVAEAVSASVPAAVPGAEPEPATRNFDAIKADLVGIFRLSRPAPFEGEVLDDDRELAFVEALGIRNPVRSFGAGRIVTIAVQDGSAVEYGQPLFYVDRR